MWIIVLILCLFGCHWTLFRVMPHNTGVLDETQQDGPVRQDALRQESTTYAYELMRIVATRSFYTPKLPQRIQMEILETYQRVAIVENNKQTEQKKKEEKNKDTLCVCVWQWRRPNGNRGPGQTEQSMHTMHKYNWNKRGSETMTTMTTTAAAMNIV